MALETLKHNYANKKVLVTGHSGFKGSWLSIWLNELGAKVMGISLPPNNARDNFNATELKNKTETVFHDIRDYNKVIEVFDSFRPDIVFHLAAQPLVADSYKDPKFTYETNVCGTLNILEAIRTFKTKAGVMITSDKCYKNIEQIWAYRENDRLGGNDPYSASKACAELMINSYLKSFFESEDIYIASARAGNVIGGGDWSANRIVPDCFRALYEEKNIIIRSPNATRPWQFVLSPLKGYLLLGERLLKQEKEFCSSFNFGPSLEDTYTVYDVVSGIINNWGKGKVIVEETKTFSESKFLQIDSTKAKIELNWEPGLKFDEVVRFTTDWYKAMYSNKQVNMYDFCKKQIIKFSEGEK